MQNAQERSPQKRKRRTRRRVSATIECATVILGGAIVARLVMMTIDLIAARNGYAPGGEIFLPVYAVLLPTIGWRLRGAWDRTKPTQKTATPKIRKEQIT